MNATTPAVASAEDVPPTASILDRLALAVQTARALMVISPAETDLLMDHTDEWTRSELLANEQLGAVVRHDPPLVSTGVDVALVKNVLRVVKVMANIEAAESALKNLQDRCAASVDWPIAARGPLRRGGNGLVFPQRAATTEDAREIFEQIESTAELRALTAREALVRRRLRQAPGIRQPLAEKEVVIVERATLKRRSKAAKRARAAQAMMESKRAALVSAGGES